jgi:hypothetical protein
MELAAALHDRQALRQEAMNAAAVFHPAANAQRVHTLFLAKLQKRIDVGAIQVRACTTIACIYSHNMYAASRPPSVQYLC